MSQHMQIRGIIPRVQYVADGNNKVFEFPFAIFNTSDIQIYIDDNLQNPSLYTVEDIRNTNGGKITFVTAPANKKIITITRNLSIERTSDFQEGGALRAKVLNDEFDYQTACLQQVADNLNRSMVLPPYAVNTNVDLTLPLPQAGKAIVWNKDGTNLENSSVEINALEKTFTEYKKSAENASLTAIQKAEIAIEAADTATEQASFIASKSDEIEQAIRNKANENLDNLSDLGKENLYRYCRPDYDSAINLGTLILPYTCPYNGYYVFYVDKAGGNKIASVFVNNTPVCMTNFSSTYASSTVVVECSQGDIVTGENTYDGKLNRTQYIPYKGV